MNNEVTNFMLYMCNRWSAEEARTLFGRDLGNHIYGKWLDAFTMVDRTMFWYSNLDSNCRQKIVDRANEIYRK